MTKDEAREAYQRDWLKLSPHERKTELQAHMFAVKMQDKYPFRTSTSDRASEIKSWLSKYIGKDYL
jgi:hypothetical protein